MRQFGTETYLKLKGAWRDLVAMSGGVSRAAQVTRGCASKISEAGAAHEMDRWACLDQIADLEAECGQPVITRALADLAGYDLTPRVAGAKSETMYQHLANICLETGDLQGQLATALADGVVDGNEANRLDREAAEAVDRINAFRASLKTAAKIKAVA